MRFTRRGMIGGAAALAALGTIVPATAAKTVARNFPRIYPVRLGIRVGNLRVITGDDRLVWKGELFEALQGADIDIRVDTEVVEVLNDVPSPFREWKHSGRRMLNLQFAANGRAIINRFFIAMHGAFFDRQSVRPFMIVDGEGFEMGDYYIEHRAVEFGEGVKFTWDMVQFV